MTKCNQMTFLPFKGLMSDVGVLYLRPAEVMEAFCFRVVRRSVRSMNTIFHKPPGLGRTLSTLQQRWGQLGTEMLFKC